MNIKQGVLSLIKWYQHSAFLRHAFFKLFFFSDSTCSFSPTCSDYLYQAIEKYGMIKGSYLGILRLLRCHPFSSGGIDPVR